MTTSLFQLELMRTALADEIRKDFEEEYDKKLKQSRIEFETEFAARNSEVDEAKKKLEELIERMKANAENTAKKENAIRLREIELTHLEKAAQDSVDKAFQQRDREVARILEEQRVNNEIWNKRLMEKQNIVHHLEERLKSQQSAYDSLNEQYRKVFNEAMSGHSNNPMAMAVVQNVKDELKLLSREKDSISKNLEEVTNQAERYRTLLVQVTEQYNEAVTRLQTHDTERLVLQNKILVLQTELQEVLRTKEAKTTFRAPQVKIELENKNLHDLIAGALGEETTRLHQEERLWASRQESSTMKKRIQKSTRVQRREPEAREKNRIHPETDTSSVVSSLTEDQEDPMLENISRRMKQYDKYLNIVHR
eukprot:PhF_6_TR14157/c0_g1_i1/m.22645